MGQRDARRLGQQAWCVRRVSKALGFYPSGLTAAGLLVVQHTKMATQSHTLDYKELAVALDVAKGTVLAPARVMVISTQYYYSSTAKYSAR